MEGKQIPDTVFCTRIPDPWRWFPMHSGSIFKNHRVLVFSLPGAFTPTCTSYQLPEFDLHYDEIRQLNIDDVYCVSINDWFTMKAWFKELNIKKVSFLPDGNGDFTRHMGMLISKHNCGMGMRSWRYAMVVDNGIVEKMFVEEGMEDNSVEDPYNITNPKEIIEYLEKRAVEDKIGPEVRDAVSSGYDAY